MKRIAIITTKWNSEFVGSCVEGILETLHMNSIEENNIDIITVPGGLEIPLTAKKLAHTGDYGAIIAVAFICENPVYRFDFVAASVVENIIRVGIETGVPILSSVLSPVKFDRDNKVDIDFYVNHMKTKGHEAAESCLEIMQVHNNIA